MSLYLKTYTLANKTRNTTLRQLLVSTVSTAAFPQQPCVSTEFRQYSLIHLNHRHAHELPSLATLEQFSIVTSEFTKTCYSCLRRATAQQMNMKIRTALTDVLIKEQNNLRKQYDIPYFRIVISISNIKNLRTEKLQIK